MYGCCGRREGLLHGPALDDLAGVHHGHLVDHLRHDAEVVGDQEDRHPELLAEVLHQLEDLGLHGDVERRRGLVGDQELGVAAQRHPDHHALAHAAGHLVRVVPHPLLGGGDPDEPHHLERAGLRLLVADVLVEPHRLGDLLADREDRVQRGHRLLEDHRDVVAADLRHRVLVERREVLAVEDDVRAGLDAAGRVDELHDRERGDGLAASGLTDDAERAALRDREVDAVDGPDQAAVGLEPGAEVLDREQVAHGLAFRGGVAARAWRRRPSPPSPARRGSRAPERRCASRAVPASRRDRASAARRAGRGARRPCA